jgi:hypothetical protein
MGGIGGHVKPVSFLHPIPKQMRPFGRAILIAVWVSSVLMSGGCTPSVARPDLSDRQLALIRADSAVFETVIRMELTGNGKEYPYKINPLRVDSRPDGQASNFPYVAGGSRGSISDPADSMRDSLALSLVREQRKAILRRLGLEEGGPFSYRQCGGTLAPPPRSPSTTSACPKEAHYYVTIGLPISGIAPGLPKRLGRPDQPVPDLSGEIWTVLVSEAYAGPQGQSWFQHAWLLRRDPIGGRLTLAHTESLAWVE